MAQKPTTFYVPRQRPAAVDQEVIDLGKWFEEELLVLSRQIQEFHLLKLEVLHVAPSRVREGMVVFADGTDWNPGSGVGAYEYRSGNWEKL